MRRELLIFVCTLSFTHLAPGHAFAQDLSPSPTVAPPTAPEGQVVDGVAARIEDDIILESEVRELAAFQKLVDGREKPRDELIRELADQWVVRGEIETAKYPPPSATDVDRAYSQLAAQFGSPEEFARRCAAVGLTEAAVRRMLQQQLHLSRFLEFRFRPAAQIDSKQIEAYYQDQFVPQLKARNESVPPLDDVEDTIREVLVQQAISDRSAQWLADTRTRLKIDIVAHGAKQ